MGLIRRTYRRIRRLRRPSEDTLIDAAFIGGLAAIVAGCAWIYLPAGPIVGGLLLVQFAWRTGHGPEAKTDPTTKRVERWYSTDTDVPLDEDEDD